MEAQRREIPGTPAFSETEGFNSPDFALLFSKTHRIPLSPLIPAWHGTMADPAADSTLETEILSIIKVVTQCFYYELPISFNARETMECVIGMTRSVSSRSRRAFAEELVLESAVSLNEHSV